MRIVVSGYFGFGNAGDEAILAGMVRSLRAERPALDITVISANPAQTILGHEVDAIPRGSPAQTIRQIRAADGLVSGGGGLMQDRTSARPVAYYAGLTQLTRMLRRPYVIYAQGLGPLTRLLNRQLAALALERAAYCSLRDEESISLARKLGVRRSIELVADPALAIVRTSLPHGTHLAVAVRTWPSPEPYLTSIRQALAILAERLPILVVPLHGAADMDACRAVVVGVPAAQVLPASASLDDRVTAIATAAVVLGMRLHALVLAAGAGVPAVAISYDPKVDGFARRAGQPVVGHVGRRIDPQTIVDAVTDALSADQAPYLHRVAAMRRTVRRAAVATISAFEAAR